MVVFLGLLSTREKTWQKQCPKGKNCGLHQKGGVAPPRGRMMSAQMQAVRRTHFSSLCQVDGLGGPAGIWTIRPCFMHLGYWKGSPSKFHLFIVSGCCIWIPHWPQEMSRFFFFIHSTSPELNPSSGMVKQSQGAMLVNSAEVCFSTSPLCVFSLSLTFQPLKQGLGSFLISRFCFGGAGTPVRWSPATPHLGLADRLVCFD